MFKDPATGVKVDQGPHLHGPNGDKYFPNTGRILDPNGNWRLANKKFRSHMEAQIRASSRGIGNGVKLVTLALLAIQINEAIAVADGRRKGELEELADKLLQFQRALEGGRTADVDAAINEIHSLFDALLGMPLAGWTMRDLLNWHVEEYFAEKRTQEVERQQPKTELPSVGAPAACTP